MPRLPHTQAPFSTESSTVAPLPGGAVPSLHALAANAAAAASVAWRKRITTREAEILDRLARGLLYREIGQELGIRTPTVKNHLHRIYAKIEVRSRTEAVVKWLSQCPSPARDNVR